MEAEAQCSKAALCILSYMAKRRPACCTLRYYFKRRKRRGGGKILKCEGLQLGI
jgi:hypothetical protein